MLGMGDCAGAPHRAIPTNRCPNPRAAFGVFKEGGGPPPGDSEIEIRQIFEAEDFGQEFTPELREQEEQLRAQMAAQGKAPA